MLQEDLYRIAKAVDYLQERQAADILAIALERLKEDVPAIIADTWVRTPARGGRSILKLFVSRADDGRSSGEVVVVTDKPESLLGWVAEHEKPLWLDDIAPGASSAVNRLDGQTVAGHYFNVDARTRSFAAIPIRYREQLRGVLSVEAAVSGRIKQAHIDAMSALEGPAGILLWKCSVATENYNHTQEAINSFRQQSARLVNSLNPYRAGFVARPFLTEFELLEKTAVEIFLRKRIRIRPYQHPPGKGMVVEEMLNQIQEAHFGIADITGLNPNVLIELGAMTSAGKPTLIFRKQDDTAPLPFDLAGYQYYSYGISDGAVVIYSASDSSSRIPLEDILNSFVGGTLMEDRSFVEAKEWRGD